MARWYFLIVSKRLVYSVSVLVCCLVLLVLFGNDPFAIFALALLPSEVTYDIMLDAGHGGIDPGAVSKNDLYEKHYVLDIVLQMEQILSGQGLKVGLTRRQDQDVSHLVDKGTRHRRDLLGRYKLMNQAALGISVHANSTKDPSVSGALVFYLKDKYLAEIYAKMVFDELERVQVMNVNHPVPRTTLLLLKAGPPVLLVEIGFMTNSTDLAKLEDPQFRSNVAQALSAGIIKFVNWGSGEQSEP